MLARPWPIVICASTDGCGSRVQSCSITSPATVARKRTQSVPKGSIQIVSPLPDTTSRFFSRVNNIRFTSYPRIRHSLRAPPISPATSRRLARATAMTGGSA